SKSLVRPQNRRRRSVYKCITRSTRKSRKRRGLKMRTGTNESGSVIVLTAMMATVLFGVVGMAVEVAGFYSLKRKMQTAADAGAKAGAIELFNGTANWTTEARRGTSQIGYTHGTDGVTVIVNSPPTTKAAAIFQTASSV